MKLIDFFIDLFQRNSLIETLKPELFTFLLCIKGYLLIPHNSILLWKNNPNLYISEEYDEKILTVLEVKL